MPVQDCEKDGKPGYQWGDAGACYTFTPGDEEGRKKAKQHAYIQGSAISASTGEPMNRSQTLMIEKALEASALPPLDAEQALAIINRLASEPVTAEQIYLRRFKLANDQLDRSYERFPVGYLERFGDTLPGRPLLIAHEKNRVGVGRWFAASVARDSEGVHHLIADAYLPADSEAAKLLKLGIANDVSIGFRAAGRTCDLCGEPIDGAYACGHQAGREYDGKRCTVTYNGDLSRVEALEGSLVGVGCQIGAEALAAKQLPAGAGAVMGIAEEGMTPQEYEARIKVLEDELATSKAAASLIEDGKLYRTDLMAEIERKAGVLEKDAALDLALLKNAEIEQIKAYDARLQAEINQKFPVAPQAKMLGAGADVIPDMKEQQAPSGPGGLRTSPFHMWAGEE